MQNVRSDGAYAAKEVMEPRLAASSNPLHAESEVGAGVRGHWLHLHEVRTARHGREVTEMHNDNQ